MQNMNKSTTLKSSSPRVNETIVSGMNNHNYAGTATRSLAKLSISVSEIEIIAIHDDDIPKRKDGSTPVIVQSKK